MGFFLVDWYRTWFDKNRGVYEDAPSRDQDYDGRREPELPTGLPEPAWLTGEPEPIDARWPE